jgi:L-iditol 2-dehydrogenase
VAQAQGADVLLVDLSPFRLDVGYQCGIKHTSDAHAEPLAGAVQRVFGPVGVDVVLECVGIEATMDAAINTIAKGGLIVVVGVFGEKPRVDLGLVQDRELTLVGTLMYRHEDYRRAIQLIADNQVLTEPLDSAHFPLADYAAAYEFIQHQSDRSMKVFIDVLEDRGSGLGIRD